MSNQLHVARALKILTECYPGQAPKDAFKNALVDLRHLADASKFEFMGLIHASHGPHWVERECAKTGQGVSDLAQSVLVDLRAWRQSVYEAEGEVA